MDVDVDSLAQEREEEEAKFYFAREVIDKEEGGSFILASSFSAVLLPESPRVSYITKPSYDDHVTTNRTLRLEAETR